LLKVASVASSAPAVLRTSIKSLSNCVVVVVSDDVTFSQKVKFLAAPVGMVIC
jgi:hypothetical protein